MADGTDSNPHENRLEPPWRPDVGTGQHVLGDPFGARTTPAVVIPADLGVPPPLLVIQGMDEGLAATPGYDRRNPRHGYFASCSCPTG